MLNRFYVVTQGILNILFAVACSADTGLSGPYLGQPSPGLKAEVFAPGIISVSNRIEGNVTFTPDGLECCVSVWSNNYNSMQYSHQVEGTWSTPTTAYFQGSGNATQCQFAPNGLCCVFVTNRRDSVEVWMSQRTFTEDNWSSPFALDAPVNLSSANAWEPSLTLDQTLYFVSQDRSDTRGRNDIYRAQYEDGQYALVENLSSPVNSSTHEESLFVAADESFVLFVRGEQRQVNGFHISFRHPDGTWTTPLNLGPIVDTTGLEYWPYVTRDNKYMFFARFISKSTASDSDIYWIEARAILPDPYGTIENQTTGQRFSSIQCAIRYASEGDTIVMEPGIYKENFTMDKDITLQSVDPNDPFYIGGTVIQGDPNEPVVTINNNTAVSTLAGLTIRAGSVGISGTTTDATIRNFRIMDNVTHGIELYESSNPHLLNCLITANGQTGIKMHQPVGRSKPPCSPVIENCIIVDNGDTALDGGEPYIVESNIED